MKAQPWWKEPTRGQWASFAAAWVGWVLDAFDFTIFLLVMPKIAKEFGVSVTATAGSITLTLLVRLLGGAVAGSVADRWGRKLPLMISMIWFATCDGLVALAPSFAWILILRTLFGFGMGAEWTSGATLAMENWPERSRGIASGILQGSWAIGYLLAAQVAGLVLPHWGWRGLFVIAAAPALLVLPIRIFVPESPDWQRDREVAKRSERSLRFLAQPKTLVTLIWASLAMALGFGVYYGLTGLYPTLLTTELGRGTADVARLVTLFNLGMLGGAVVCGTLAARRGIVLAIIAPALVTVGALPLYVGAAPRLLWLGALLGGAFGAGICGVVPHLLTSLFAPSIRARAVGLVYHAGAFAAAFVPTAVAALHEYKGLPLARAIGLVAGGSALALAALMPLAPRASRVQSGELPAAEEPVKAT